MFAIGSTVAVTTMEYEPGGVHDLQALLDRLIPAEGDYEHNRLNHDTNSHAHLRAALIGPSETIPIVAGELALGTWQQIVLIDFDDRPRSRTVDRPGPVLSLCGEPVKASGDSRGPCDRSPARDPLGSRRVTGCGGVAAKLFQGPRFRRYTHRSAPESARIPGAP